MSHLSQCTHLRELSDLLANCQRKTAHNSDNSAFSIRKDSVLRSRKNALKHLFIWEYVDYGRERKTFGNIYILRLSQHV